MPAVAGQGPHTQAGGGQGGQVAHDDDARLPELAVGGYQQGGQQGGPAILAGAAPHFPGQAVGEEGDEQAGQEADELPGRGGDTNQEGGQGDEVGVARWPVEGGRRGQGQQTVAQRPDGVVVVGVGVLAIQPVEAALADEPQPGK